VSETEVQDALLINDRHDQLVIAYHLIIDNKRIWNEGLFEKKILLFFERFLFSSKSRNRGFFCGIKSTTFHILINDSKLKINLIR
jgi:hypothetical protein